MRAMAGRTAGSSKTKLGMGTHVDPWADPDGVTGGTCPLQTNDWQKWSDRFGFVSLAS